jgi:hypothetical protein
MPIKREFPVEMPLQRLGGWLHAKKRRSLLIADEQKGARLWLSQIVSPVVAYSARWRLYFY